MRPDTREMLGNLFKEMQEATIQSSWEETAVVCIPADQGGGGSMHRSNRSLGKRIFFYPCCQPPLISVWLLIQRLLIKG